MDILFNATIDVPGQASLYQVYFDEEAYIFQSIENNSVLLQLYRDRDEWHTKDTVNKQTKDQAIQALDNYLLSQH
jgi:hypothetical protein